MRKTSYPIKLFWSDKAGKFVAFGFMYKRNHYTYDANNCLYVNDSDPAEYLEIIPNSAKLDARSEI